MTNELEADALVPGEATAHHVADYLFDTAALLEGLIARVEELRLEENELYDELGMVARLTRMAHSRVYGAGVAAMSCSSAAGTGKRSRKKAAGQVVAHPASLTAN